MWRPRCDVILPSCPRPAHPVHRCPPAHPHFVGAQATPTFRPETVDGFGPPNIEQGTYDRIYGPGRIQPSTSRSRVEISTAELFTPLNKMGE